jgi:hypothetical protein
VIPLLTATTPTADTNASANKDTTATDESMDLDAKMSTNAQKECTTADLNQSVKTTTAVSVANVDQDSSETHQLFDAPSRVSIPPGHFNYICNMTPYYVT